MNRRLGASSIKKSYGASTQVKEVEDNTRKELLSPKKVDLDTSVIKSPSQFYRMQYSKSRRMKRDGSLRSNFRANFTSNGYRMTRFGADRNKVKIKTVKKRRISSKSNEELHTGLGSNYSGVSWGQKISGPSQSMQSSGCFGFPKTKILMSKKAKQSLEEAYLAKSPGRGANQFAILVEDSQKSRKHLPKGSKRSSLYSLHSDEIEGMICSEKLAQSPELITRYSWIARKTKIQATQENILTVMKGAGIQKRGYFCKALKHRSKESILKAKLRYKARSERVKSASSTNGFVDYYRKLGRHDVDLKHRRTNLEVFRPSSMDIVNKEGVKIDVLEKTAEKLRKKKFSRGRNRRLRMRGIFKPQVNAYSKESMFNQGYLYGSGGLRGARIGDKFGSSFNGNLGTRKGDLKRSFGDMVVQAINNEFQLKRRGGFLKGDGRLSLKKAKSVMKASGGGLAEFSDLVSSSKDKFQYELQIKTDPKERRDRIQMDQGVVDINIIGKQQWPNE